MYRVRRPGFLKRENVPSLWRTQPVTDAFRNQVAAVLYDGFLCALGAFGRGRLRLNRGVAVLDCESIKGSQTNRNLYKICMDNC